MGKDLVLPFNLDAEKTLLGSVILDPKEALGEAIQAGIITESFHNPAHRMIWAAIQEARQELGTWRAGTSISEPSFGVSPRRRTLPLTRKSSRNVITGESAFGRTTR